jgi:hypothetical protein
MSDLILDAMAGRRVGPTGWARANCPLCELRTSRADKNQCLGMRAATGFWHCFRCGAAGVIELPEDFDTREPAKREAPEAVRMELPEGYLRLYEEPGWGSWAAEPARAYLRARGVDDDTGHDCQIGVCLEGRYRGRVVVPVLDATGKTLLGWSARDYVGRSDRKYLYPTGMQRAEILYNHAALLVPTLAPVFVVEGVFDAIALWPDAVACLGKPSDSQIEALIAGRRPVVVALDGDAWHESEMLAVQLRLEGKRVGWLHLPAKKDPASVPEADMRRAGQHALEDGSAQVRVTV